MISLVFNITNAVQDLDRQTRISPRKKCIASPHVRIKESKLGMMVRILQELRASFILILDSSAQGETKKEDPKKYWLFRQKEGGLLTQKS